MYQPLYHREDRLPIQHTLIRAYPLGTLITLGPDGLEGNPVPFILDEKAGSKGILRAHIARANRVWRDFDSRHEALVVFMGPQTYVSPSWYASKQESGKVVPTWNYACVHVYGQISVIEDRDWLMKQIRDLTELEERDRPSPWSVDDAPESYVSSMVNAIVGIEIAISRIEGKWKVSQNRSPADRQGVIAGLIASGDENDLAMAELVAEAARDK
jgi:transcriptional regulator